MPLYVLRCINCGQEGEVILPLNAEIPLCSKCQSEQKRVISAPAMIRIDNIPIKYKSLGITPFKSWEPGPSEV